MSAPSPPPLPLLSIALVAGLRAVFQATGRDLPRAVRLGPWAVYSPRQGWTQTPDGTWRHATPEDDALALQLMAWDGICAATKREVDEELLLVDDAHNMRRYFVVKRFLHRSSGLWRLAVLHMERCGDTYTRVRWAWLLPEQVDLLTALEAFGAVVHPVDRALDELRRDRAESVIDLPYEAIEDEPHTQAHAH